MRDPSAASDATTEVSSHNKPPDPLPPRASAWYGAALFVGGVVLSALVTLAARNPVARMFSNVGAWMLVQPAPHIYSWAKREPAIYIALITCVVGCVTTLTWAGYSSRIPIPNTDWTITTKTSVAILTIEDFVFNIFAVGGVSLICYYFERRDKTPAELRKEMMSRRSIFLPVVWLVVCFTIVAETIRSGFYEAYWNTQPWIFNDFDVVCTVGYILLCVLMIVLVMFRERWLRVTFSFAHLLAYMPTLSFGTVVSTRVLDLLVTLLHVQSANVDLFLPVIFIVYKIFFSLVLPYLYIMAARMGGREMATKFIFVAQFAETLFLDGVSIISTNLSAVYIVFLLLRAIHGTLLCGGAFRWMTDRIGITRPMDLVAVPPGEGDAGQSERPQTLASLLRCGGKNGVCESACRWRRRRKGGVGDVPNSDGDSGTTGADDDEGDSIDFVPLAERLRRPYGDTPMAQLVFALQHYAASLLSPFCILMMIGLDITFDPAHCTTVCNVPIGAVASRAACTLGAWLVGVVASGVVMRRRLHGYGITDKEMAQTLLLHLRRSLTVLVTTPALILYIFSTDVAIVIKRINAIDA